MCEVSDQLVFDDIIRSNRAVLVDIYASWCGPCKAIAPVIDQFESMYQNVSFIKVNCDESQDIAHNLGITSLPTFIAYLNGREIDRIFGANKDRLHALVERLAY